MPKITFPACLDKITPSMIATAFGLDPGWKSRGLQAKAPQADKLQEARMFALSAANKDQCLTAVQAVRLAVINNHALSRAEMARVIDFVRRNRDN